MKPGYYFVEMKDGYQEAVKLLRVFKEGFPVYDDFELREGMCQWFGSDKYIPFWVAKKHIKRIIRKIPEPRISVNKGDKK